MACTKEKILKKNNFPDKGEVYMVGYINNIPGNGLTTSNIIKNLGISIYGKNVANMGISLYLDTGIGFEKLPIVYVSKYFQYDYDMSFYRFVPYKKYTFKLVSKLLNDSLIIEKYLPNNYSIETEQKYISKNEYFFTHRIIDTDNINDFIYDNTYNSGSSGDTFKGGVAYNGYASLYSATNLPDIKNGDYNTYSEILNINNYSITDELRIPFTGNKCSYIPYQTKDFILEFYKFHNADFEYITSAHQNIINYGNPFFLSYQLKNIQKSKSEKLFGYIVAANVQRSEIYKIRDNSEQMAKIYIKDINGVDIINNANYYISSSGISGIKNKIGYKKDNSLNYFYITENQILYYLSDCNDFNSDKNPKFGYQFTIRNNITGKTSKTQEIITDLNNLPKDLIFTLK